MDSYANIRLPHKLKQEAQQLVKAGYFKNLSDLIVAGIREQIYYYKPSKAVLETRMIRRQIWNKFMREAKGDEKFASDLYWKDMKKHEKEFLQIFKPSRS